MQKLFTNITIKNTRFDSKEGNMDWPKWNGRILKRSIFSIGNQRGVFDLFSNTKFKFAPNRNDKDEIAGLIKYSKREDVKKLYEKMHVQKESNVHANVFCSKFCIQ